MRRYVSFLLATVLVLTSIVGVEAQSSNSNYQQCVQDAILSGLGNDGLRACMSHLEEPDTTVDVNIPSLGGDDDDDDNSSSNSGGSNNQGGSNSSVDDTPPENPYADDPTIPIGAVVPYGASAYGRGKYPSDLKGKEMCPPRARGTTKAEKERNPRVLCKCIDGYRADPTGRYCISREKYDPPPPPPPPQQPVSKQEEANTSNDSLLVIELPSDVPEDTWYSDTLLAFMHEGYLPYNLPFRPSENATRGEFIELLVRMVNPEHRIPNTAQQVTPIFDDVTDHRWRIIETAALNGWVKGENECVGTRPCYARPDSPINRAEAAALINRIFELESKTEVPLFTDVDTSAWYIDSIRTAASHCILRGDAGSTTVRPADSMNRAEMIAMVGRTENESEYPYCDGKSPVVRISFGE